MPFTNQFSLTLELTSLVPLVLDVVGKSYSAAMSLARDLQSSGSDIVVEEDLTHLFGRSRISPTLASSFRTVISQIQEPKELCEGLYLQHGPGPTVTRALQANAQAYFSTIVQCSFLVAIHEKASLGSALGEFFERQSYESANEARQWSAPSSEGIKGTLTAIESQTSSFDWVGLLEASNGIPSSVFRGLLTMLPLVQHFPEEHLISIKTTSGISAIVVWAHHILGLSVSVTLEDANCQQSLYRFGEAPEQVLIQTNPNSDKDTVTLLSADKEEIRLKVDADLDDAPIRAIKRRPTKGVLRRRLEDLHCIKSSGRERLISEISHVTSAYALLLSKSLYRSNTNPQTEAWLRAAASVATLSRGRKSARIFEEELYEMPKDRLAREGNDMKEGGNAQTSSDGSFSGHSESEFYGIKFVIPADRVVRTARILFNSKLKEQEILDYAKQLPLASIQEMEQPPRVIATIMEAWNDPQSLTESWQLLRNEIKTMAIVILAFANVHDLEDTSGLPIQFDDRALRSCEIYKATAHWDGETPIGIPYYAWFELIAILMMGHDESVDANVSLISENGWSIFHGIYGSYDPCSVIPGSVSIERGVPCRNKVRKGSVRDYRVSNTAGPLPLKKSAGAGDSISLHCALPGTFGRTLVGEEGDSFVVSRQLLITLSESREDKNINSLRAGYCELFHALWMTQTTQPCQHNYKPGDSVTLDPGCIALAGYDMVDFDDSLGRLAITLTAGSLAARWRALLGIKKEQMLGFSYYPVMLRDHDCCLQCAIDQTSKQDGDWWLVL